MLTFVAAPLSAHAVAPVREAPLAREGRGLCWRRSSGLSGLSVGVTSAAVAVAVKARVRRRATKGDEIKFATSNESKAVSTAPPVSLQQWAQGTAERLPALAQLSGSVVVIKYGGAAMVESPERTMRDVAALAAMGLKPVLVHGGGPEINSWLAKVGIEPKFVRGLRVTDADTMEVVAMVLMGKVNKGIVATMGAAGVSAVGLSGVDGGLLQAKKVDDEELGFVGEVTGVREDLLLTALEEGFVPVVATVAADDEGNFLNAEVIAMLDTRDALLSPNGVSRSIKRQVALHRVDVYGPHEEPCAWIMPAAGPGTFFVYYSPMDGIQRPDPAMTIFTKGTEVDRITESQGNVIAASDSTAVAAAVAPRGHRGGLWVKEGTDMALVTCLALAVQKLGSAWTSRMLVGRPRAVCGPC